MDALVTGATGFVGRALVAALMAQGHSVHALVRTRSGASAQRRMERLGATLVTGDVTDEASVLRAARAVDTVFHAAALVDFAATREALATANLVGTENVLGACRSAGVRRLVHVSSETVTRGLEPRSYVDERYPQPANFLDGYSETKALAEDLVMAAHGGGIETVCVRPAWVWGPDDTSVLPELVRRVQSGRFGWIDGGRSLCATTYIRSLADALVRAAIAPEAAGNVYYVTDDERISIREFASQLLTAAGLRVPRRSAPFGVAFAAATVAEKLMTRPPLRRVEVVLSGRSYHFNIQRARKDLGYVPMVTIREGMDRLRAWVSAIGGATAVARAEVSVEAPEM